MSIRQGKIIIADSVSSTTDYQDLINKPKINGVELDGNKTTEDLNINVGITSVNGDTGTNGAVTVKAIENANPNDTMLKIWNGTTAEYLALAEKDLNTVYNVTDEVTADSSKISGFNPFSLLDYKWSEYEITNASWLLSNGAFHSGATYIAVYELLLKIKNGTETKDGVSVKLSTEAYTDTDFVINTADTTFRLPIKVKLASGKAVVGNGMTLGLTDGTNNVGLISDLGAGINTVTGVYNQDIGVDSWTQEVGTKGLGVTTDPTKSGIETSSSGLKLYFYVGETIQDANLINVGNVFEQLATKTDSVQAAAASMPSSRYIDLTLGASGTTYTAPANGWFTLNFTSSGTNGFIAMYARIAASSTANSGRYGITAGIPVAKGENMSVFYGNGSADLFRFYYAEGEK